jgi:hypothetical protein
MTDAEMYAECVEIYSRSKNPISDILAFAEQHNITRYAYCQPCEYNTPRLRDSSCMVCGS